MFPVDPRDFVSQKNSGDATTCVANNIVSTDPPSSGALFSWSLGDPFMKSNTVVFYYGNLTHPSVDPPRIGFLSNVPQNASALLQDAVSDAQQDGGNFESTLSSAIPSAKGVLTLFHSRYCKCRAHRGNCHHYYRVCIRVDRRVHYFYDVSAC